MASAFIVYKERNNPDELIKVTETFDEYWIKLNNRYENFYINLQHATSNKTTPAYIVFSEKLENGIESQLQRNSAKTSVYDGASICGQESCGGGPQNNTTLGCIAGASMAELYCIRNNMGNCSDLREAVIDECCAQFCNPQ